MKVFPYGYGSGPWYSIGAGNINDGDGCLHSSEIRVGYLYSIYFKQTNNQMFSITGTGYPYNLIIKKMELKL